MPPAFLGLKPEKVTENALKTLMPIGFQGIV